MLKIKIFKLKKVKQILKKLPRVLVEKAFLTFLGLLLIALIFGLFIFYQYSILAEKAKPEFIEKPLKFKEKTYQTILKEWQKRNQRFLEIDSKKYPNPF